MNVNQLVEIPDDLAAEAAQVEGIGARLLCFLRAEVSQNRKRQSLHSAEAREIVRRAREEAEQMRAAGVTREEAMASFEKNYLEILKQL